MMNQTMHEGMAEATRLTRAGKLTEATALIQHLLRGFTPAASDLSTDRYPHETIDGTSRVVTEAPLPPKAAVREPDRQTPDAAKAMRSASEVRPSLLAHAPAVSPDGKSTAAPGAAGTDARASADEHRHDGLASVIGRSKWLGRLRALLGVTPGVDRATRPPQFVPAPSYPGQFIEASYTNHAGTRDYKLYVPTGYQGQALPLVVMLHGCTQSPDDIAAGSRMNELAESELFLVAYPAQSAAANQNKCWNWFQAADQRRDYGEPSIIAGITRQIVNTYHLDPRRVYVAGMSAGGAMAAIMGAEYPDLYAAIGVHSGLAYGAAHDLPSAFAAMRRGAGNPGGTNNGRVGRGRSSTGTPSRGVPTIVFHGDKDKTVHPHNGNQVAQGSHGEEAPGAPAAKLRPSVDRGQVVNGRAYTRSIYRDSSGQAVIEQWLVHGAGHAWSGGSSAGSYTDPRGPDASREMTTFFYKHVKSDATLRQAPQ